MESRRTFVPYLPRLVVEWSRDAPGRSSQVLDGSLVSVDISGFTSLAERLQAKGRAGAEELVLLLGGIFEALIGVSGRLAGDVLKFRGDALLVFFAGDGHELRAARAAADMQWCIEHMGPTMSSAGEVKLRMSAGVYSGPCHFFLVDSSHRELVVTGPAATETIRLESAAGAGEVAVSPATAAVLDAGWVAGATNGASLLHLAALQDAGGGAPPAADSPEPVDGLESFIPAPLRSHLLRGMGEAEHRQITAGFLAYSGVDTLLSLDGVDGVAAALGALGSLVGEVTSELAITWLESDIDTDGGKLYLTAGAPLTTGADEERMLRALRTLVDEPSPLMLRAGVNRGPAFAGDVGSSTRRTYAVMGDVVNLAARLAARAGPGQILATSEVLDRSNTRYAVEPQPFLMKGKERAITAYRVAESVGTAPAAPERQLPIVGRDPELAALLAAVEGARMRTPHTIELVGEPGIGKSRLVAETRELTAGFTQLVGHCDQYRSSTAFYALRGVLRTLAGIPDELSAAEAGARLKPWVEAVIPDLAPLLPLLAIPFEAEVPSTPESDEIDPAFRRARLHTVVEQFLVRVLVMPTLLVFEDAHWMDDASFSLLQHLSASRIPRPWLTVITRRPSGTPLLTEGEDWAEVLELQPLPPEQASQLALAVAGELALPEDVVAAVSARSGGNPLFVRELVTASRGEVDGAGALPETIETLLTARIDTLDPDERFLLRNAAVLGGRFELSLLREVLGDDLEDPGDLDRWRRLGEFVRWDGPDELHFLHDLFRTVAYEGLSFRRRRDVHGRVARVLEARAGDDVSEIAAFLSLHYSRAEAHAESWRYSVQAGDLARKSFANVDAAELYQRALAATEHVEIPSEEVGRVAESLGDVLELAGRYDAARAAYVRAGIHVTDPVSEARYLLKDGIVSERLGHYPDALDRYDRALERIGAVPGEQAPLELAVAGVKYRQGHFHEGIEWKQHAADACRAGGRPREPGARALPAARKQDRARGSPIRRTRGARCRSSRRWVTSSASRAC